MSPHPAGIPAFAAGWIAAALLGGGATIWLLRRGGLEGWKSTAVLFTLIVSLLVGSKVLFLVESAPRWWSSPPDFSVLLMSPHMRIPGGFLLALATASLVARAIRVRYFWLCDQLIPAAGLCIAGIRLGCLLEGCCFGTPTAMPWAVRFPAGSGPYWWQVKHGLIAPTVIASLPVHPLQLYFAGVGLLLFAGALIYRRRRRFEGELLLLFLVTYLWSTWLLELLRAVPHDVTRQVVLVAALSVTGLTAVIEWQRRQCGAIVPRWSPGHP